MDFDIPILLIVFNRLEQTKLVFQEIRKARPSKFYISADGARDSVTDEGLITEKIKEYVLSHIDWPCIVETRFNPVNLGCKQAVSSGISWFFENEPMGIILEDDCLPNQSFFKFCRHSLLKYKDDERIWHVAGHSIIPKSFTKGHRESYYFSYFSHVWGWATWADRWKYYDVNLENIEDDKFLNVIFKRKSEREYWSKIFHQVKNRQFDTWDYQWTFTCWKRNAFSVVPWKNLISNIGFGEGATHTTETDSFLSGLTRYDLDQIIDPDLVKRSIRNDDYESRIVFTPSLFRRIKLRIKKFYFKILYPKMKNNIPLPSSSKGC